MSGVEWRWSVPYNASEGKGNDLVLRAHFASYPAPSFPFQVLFQKVYKTHTKSQNKLWLQRRLVEGKSREMPDPKIPYSPSPSPAQLSASSPRISSP